MSGTHDTMVADFQELLNDMAENNSDYYNWLLGLVEEYQLDS